MNAEAIPGLALTAAAWPWSSDHDAPPARVMRALALDWIDGHSRTRTATLFEGVLRGFFVSNVIMPTTHVVAG
jgi:hypothetical protein